MGGVHMVTAPNPHPLHANTTTATLWIARETTAILNNLALLALALTFGNLFLYHPPSLEFASPARTQIVTVIAFFALAAATNIATRALSRALRLHTPGAITPPPANPHRAPDIATTTVSTLCTWAALAIVIAIIPSGNWATPGVFITLGIAMTAASLSAAAVSAIRRRIDRSGTRIQIQIDPAIFGISLIVTGGIIYQSATLPAFGRSLIELFICLGVLVAIVYAVLDCIRHAPPSTGTSPISSAVTDFALRNRVAPTLADRKHTQSVARRTGLIVIAALAVGVIVSEFVGMPWPLIVGTIGCVGTAIAAVLVLKDQRIDWRSAQ